MSGADGYAVLVLLTTGLVLAWPILRGGYETYLDNPVHLAEIHSMAFDARGGWSDLSFCGFPLHLLHSPLWYGLLAVLARLHLPAGPLYGAMVLAGLLAPPLALYKVARRRLPPAAAGGIAYLLLLQRPGFIGYGSATGGMWTYYLGASGLVLLAGHLGRETPSRRDAFWTAAGVGLISLTHLFVLPPLLVLAAIHAGRTALRGAEGRRRLLRESGAAGLGLLAASAYWLPAVLTRGTMTWHAQNLGASRILARLLVPTDVLHLIFVGLPVPSLGLLLQALPMLALAAMFLPSLLFLRDRRDDAPLYGALLAAVFLVLLVWIVPSFDLKILGPVSWRLLYFVRIGMALSAIPLLARLSSRRVGSAPREETARREDPGRRGLSTRSGSASRLGRTAAALLGLAGIVLGAIWGAPLRAAVPALHGREMAEVRELWDWLAAHRSRDWGRVYLQDTFMVRPGQARLANSHVLALTARETGVLQLGAAYGIVPYPTRWTLSEFGTLYGRMPVDEARLREIVSSMHRTNATHLVTSDPDMARVLSGTPAFQLLHRVGRFSVLRLAGSESEWVSAEPAGAPRHGQPAGSGSGPTSNAPPAGVEAASFEVGKVKVRFTEGGPPGDLLVKVSFHPFWRLEGSANGTLGEDPDGLIRVSRLELRDREITLTYDPPRWPARLSFTAWIGILALGLAARGPGGDRARRGSRDAPDRPGGTG